MKEDTIKGRIDRNIEDLLVHMTTNECIEKLNKIKHNFSDKITNNNESTARERYIRIYVDHTDKRIHQLSTMKNKGEFKKLLYKEKLQNKEHVPNTYSHKYKTLTLNH